MAVPKESIAQHVAEAASGTWASKTAAGTGFSLFGFGLFTWNDIAMIGGLLIGVGTFGVNWYYRHQEFKLKQEQHRASMFPHDAHDGS